jgi:DNA-directed RNA polymerase specialized sigma24 family protein
VSSTSGPDDAKRFITPFDACASRVFAYVCRHVERNAVEDIVAETFLTAWRRTEGVPEVPLPRLLAMAAI